MRRPLAGLLSVFLAVAAPAVASAQTTPAPWRPADPTRPAWSPRPASTAEAHRFEMDRLRGVADANRDAARLQSLQARQALEILRARQSPPPPTPPVRLTIPPAQPLPPPADTRPTGDVSQIDAWLDRKPD